MTVPRPDTGADFPQVLRHLADVAAEVGAKPLVDEAASLADRLAEGRFFVACVGQFKRGKSTLINALLGDPVLPTGVVPVTALVTVVRYGERRAVRVRRAGGAWEKIVPARLAAYVTEEQNPGNRERVDGVEVFVPSPLLASGLCLVDTPGLGSVFSESTRVARAFIPHVDAGLVVLGADPPISGEELALVEDAAKETDRFLFVLNKADRLTDTERGEARVFTERVLTERLGRAIGPLLEVSATERLAGPPTRDWKALEAALEALARASGVELVRVAATRGAARLADRLLQTLDEHRDALVRPLDESASRVTALRQSVVEAERALRDLGPLFGAEQERLARQLDEARRGFLARALPWAMSELDRAIWSRGDGRAERLRTLVMEAARAIARWHVTDWIREIEPVAESLYRQATGRFIELANGFLARLKASGDPAFTRLPAELALEAGFRAKPHFYFTDLLALTGLSTGGWVRALIRPGRTASTATRREAEAYLVRLLETNSARVANDLVERVLQSRRGLEAELASRVRELVTSAEHALEQARERHVVGAEAVRAEIARLESLRRRVVARCS